MAAFRRSHSNLRSIPPLHPYHGIALCSHRDLPANDRRLSGRRPAATALRTGRSCAGPLQPLVSRHRTTWGSGILQPGAAEQVQQRAKAAGNHRDHYKRERRDLVLSRIPPHPHHDQGERYDEIKADLRRGAVGERKAERSHVAMLIHGDEGVRAEHKYDGQDYPLLPVHVVRSSLRWLPAG
jgi:hypothetical protein